MCRNMTDAIIMDYLKIAREGVAGPVGAWVGEERRKIKYINFLNYTSRK